MPKQTGDKGAKPALPKAPSVSADSEIAETVVVEREVSEITEQPEKLEAKAAHCDVCGGRFVPTNAEPACPTCYARLQKHKAASMPGYVLCEVVGEGFVSANGFIDGQLKTTFKAGDIAEFAKADVDSLPGRFRVAQ